MHDLRVAGMAPTTFHRHFKAFTSLSRKVFKSARELYRLIHQLVKPEVVLEKETNE